MSKINQGHCTDRHCGYAKRSCCATIRSILLAAFEEVSRGEVWIPELKETEREKSSLR